MDNKLIRNLILCICILALNGCSIFSPHSAYFEGVKDRLEKGMDINSSINEDQDTVLHTSVQNNSLKEVEFLLRKKADPNKENKLGLPPLLYINSRSNTDTDEIQADIIIALAEAGADINFKAKNGMTALTSAILENRPLSVKAILDSGARTDIKYNGDTPLILAVKGGNITIIRELLTKKPDLTIENSKGQTALGLTAFKESAGADKEQAEIAEALVSAGAKTKISYSKNIVSVAINNHRPLVAKILIDSTELNDALDENDFSPLMKAVYKGELSLVKELVSSPTEINYRAKNDWTALHLTAYKGSSGGDDLQEKIATLLIKAGADVNKQGPHQNTALSIAITNNRTKVAQTLLSENTDISIKNDTGESPLMLAVQTGNLNLVEKLASSNTINMIDNYGWNALHFTAYKENLAGDELQSKIANILIKSGINIDQQNNNGFTSLHLAIKNNFQTTTQTLLDNKADITLKDKNGQTPLMHAVQENAPELVKKIIVFSQNLDTKDNNGWTALHFTLKKEVSRSDVKSAEIARLLINAGANINIQTKNQSSALHLAIKHNALLVTQVLINAKANPTLRNNKNMTPLMIAVQNANLPIVRILAGLPQDLNVKQENGWSALHFTAYSENKNHDAIQAQIANTLIKSGADINSKIDTGEPPLSIAIGNNHPLITNILLDAKANIDIIDNNGWTPLMLAVYLGKIDVVKKSIPLSKNLNIKNNDGLTALHLTANSNSFGGDLLQSQIAELLIDAGANVNTQATEGSTALHFAAANNKIAVAKALLAANASSALRNLKGWNAKDEATKAKNIEMAKLLR